MSPLPESSDPVVRIEVAGDLDLHTYRPRDLPELLPAWFGECHRLGIATVRVIHGKGSGSLRAGVHALLPRLTRFVAAWTFPAPEAAGGWGATVVQLVPPAPGANVECQDGSGSRDAPGEFQPREARGWQ